MKYLLNMLIYTMLHFLFPFALCAICWPITCYFWLLIQNKKHFGPTHHYFRYQNVSPSGCDNAEDLGMSHSQRFHMGILLHVLYSNPKVLYAPNNTEVDEIIRKVTTALAQGMRINTRTCIGCYFVLEEVPACLVDRTMCICGIVYFPGMSFPTLHEILPRCAFGGLPEYVYTGEKANTQQMNDSI